MRSSMGRNAFCFLLSHMCAWLCSPTSWHLLHTDLSIAVHSSSAAACEVVPCNHLHVAGWDVTVGHYQATISMPVTVKCAAE